MNSTDEKQRKEESPPSRDLEFKRMLEEYISDLRTFMAKLRRMLN